MHDRRWVVDTNVLVSRLLMAGGTAARAVDRALSSGVLLVSDETLAELAEVLARPRFDRYASRADRAHFVRLLGGGHVHFEVGIGDYVSENSAHDGDYQEGVVGFVNPPIT